MKYHIALGNQIITEEPLELQLLIKAHGSVKKLESSGFRLIPIKSFENRKQNTQVSRLSSDKYHVTKENV